LHKKTGKTPSKLQLEDLDAARITAFLAYLENERGNSVRTRNARLTAIHSFFHFTALKIPERADLIARGLDIPEKRSDTTLISYLTEPEVDALLGAPDRSTWTGRRDHALLLLAMQTGLRVSELASLRCEDVQLSTGAWVRCEGKGRQERSTPLTRATVQVLRVWLRERDGHPTSPLFPSRSGRHLTRGAIWRRVVKHTATARQRCPSLGDEEHHPARLATHGSDAVTAGAHAGSTRRRLRCGSATTRSIRQQVSPRRHGTQTTGARSHHATQRQTRPLPPARQATRVPRGPLIAEICRPQKPGHHQYARRAR